MLSFHGLFIISLLELKLSELFFGDSELVSELTNLLVVVSVFIKLDQGFLLLFLHLEQ